MSYLNHKTKSITIETTTPDLPIKDLPWVLQNCKEIKILPGKMIIYSPSEILLEELENRGIKFRRW